MTDELPDEVLLLWPLLLCDDSLMLLPDSDGVTRWSFSRGMGIGLTSATLIPVTGSSRLPSCFWRGNDPLGSRCS